MPAFSYGVVGHVKKSLPRVSRRLILPLSLPRCDDVWIELPKVL